MNHVEANSLREYHFQLLDETATAAVTAHLETCADCRAELARVQRQFAALDLLCDQPAVSEERLASILASSRPSESARRIPFRSAVLLAAAACLALAFVWVHRPNELGNAPSIASAPSLIAEAVPSLVELRSEKPFAPASNIELNVLPRRDEVQLTIYNAKDLTLVREKRKMTLKRGWNWLQFMWANTLIDPTSLELLPVSHSAEVEITQLVYPPGLNELARWTLFSEVSGEVEFELTYLTSGLQWNANYEATLSPDEKNMALKSRVRVDNHSGEEYANAQTRLVVGEINLKDSIAGLAKRQHAYHRPNREFKSISTMKVSRMNGAPHFEMPAVDFFGCKQKQIIKQALSEYQLYTIEGRETIPDGWGKRLPNFEASDIGVTNLYKFDEERWGHEAYRFLSFANTEGCALGETPLPAGQLCLFQQVKGGSGLSYAAGTRLDYIPVGEEIELELGVAKSVIIAPTLMRTRTENITFDAHGNLASWDEITDWRIEIRHGKSVPIKVEVMRSALANDWALKCDVPFERYDATHFKFTQWVEPQEKQIIEYELKIHTQNGAIQ